jgi:hypothetical protein
LVIPRSSPNSPLPQSRRNKTIRLVVHEETSWNDTLHASNDKTQFQFHPYLYLLCIAFAFNLYMHLFPTYHHSRLMKEDTSFGTYSAALLTNSAIDLRDRGLADIFRRSTDSQIQS